jgi:hypothetical protein
MLKYSRFIIAAAFLAGCAASPPAEQPHTKTAAKAIDFDHVAIYVADLPAPAWSG